MQSQEQSPACADVTLGDFLMGAMRTEGECFHVQFDVQYFVCCRQHIRVSLMWEHWTCGLDWMGTLHPSETI